MDGYSFLGSSEEDEVATDDGRDLGKWLSFYAATADYCIRMPYWTIS